MDRSILTSPGAPLVIGHRGAAAVLPENTVPSFEHALQLGVDAVEFDVRVTADGVAIVHHDPDTTRTCGERLVVAETAWATLRTLDAGSTFGRDGARVAPTAIPRLDDVLEVTRDLPVIIECKTVAAADVVLDVLARHAATARAIVGSFLHPAMEAVRRASQDSGASRRDMVALYARSLVRLRPHRLPYTAMCIPEHFGALTLPVARFAAWGRRCGVPVHVWTVNNPADALRLWAGGVTGVLTDDPALLLAARADLRR
jgi:glycerophosphoryl diester phosphodiesterase